MDGPDLAWRSMQSHWHCQCHIESKSEKMNHKTVLVVHVMCSQQLHKVYVAMNYSSMFVYLCVLLSVSGHASFDRESALPCRHSTRIIAKVLDPISLFQKWLRTINAWQVYSPTLICARHVVDCCRRLCVFWILRGGSTSSLQQTFVPWRNLCRPWLLNNTHNHFAAELMVDL